ncbi:hypothetical protein EGW08_004470, partial [Elysia chlorotica]
VKRGRGGPGAEHRLSTPKVLERSSSRSRELLTIIMCPIMASFFGALIFSVVISANVANLTPSVEMSCELGGLQTTNTRYFSIVNNTCFIFMVHENVSFQTAAKNCNSFGGNLAMPKTKDVNDFLLEEMGKINATESMWIGLNDKDVEGEWKWMDGTQVQFWNNMEQSNYGLSIFEDCVALNPQDRQWHDYRCTTFLSKKLPYICQYAIDGAVNGQVDKIPHVNGAKSCPPFDCPDLVCDSGFKFDDGCLLCECTD